MGFPSSGNDMNQTVLIAIILGVFVAGSFGPFGIAFGQYMGNVGGQGETGAYTLEEALEIQRRRIEAVQANPHTGSGTPYISADGVIGASAISAAVFGGIAGAFFFKGRSGKYAAQGRG